MGTNSRQASGNRPSLDDYVDVAVRIQDFMDAHPNGSLQTIGWEIVTVEGFNARTKQKAEQTFVVYRAAAYRSPDDLRPGMGIAWEPFPGLTPYTANSELMNAETAAWGRAIVALGLSATKGLASRQEVRNRAAEQDAESDSEPAEKATEKPSKGKASNVAETAAEVVKLKLGGPQLDALRAELAANEIKPDKLKLTLVQIGVELDMNDADALKKAIPALTLDQLSSLCEALELDFHKVTGTQPA